MIKRLVVLGIVSLVLSACSATQQERFTPKYQPLLSLEQQYKSFKRFADMYTAEQERAIIKKINSTAPKEI